MPLGFWPWATETNPGFSKQVNFIYHGKNRRRLTEFKGRMENLACIKQTKIKTQKSSEGAWAAGTNGEPPLNGSSRMNSLQSHLPCSTSDSQDRESDGVASDMCPLHGLWSPGCMELHVQCYARPPN